MVVSSVFLHLSPLNVNSSVFLVSGSFKGWPSLKHTTTAWKILIIVNNTFLKGQMIQFPRCSLSPGHWFTSPTYHFIHACKYSSYASCVPMFTEGTLTTPCLRCFKRICKIHSVYSKCHLLKKIISVMLMKWYVTARGVAWLTSWVPTREIQNHLFFCFIRLLNKITRHNPTLGLWLKSYTYTDQP